MTKAAKVEPKQKRRTVQDMLAALEFDPIEHLVRIATDPAAKPELRAKVCVELSQFLPTLTGAALLLRALLADKDRATALIEQLYADRPNLHNSTPTYRKRRTGRNG